MRSYLKADFYRIWTRKSRIFLVLLLAIADLFCMIKAVSSGRNVIELTNEVCGLDFLYTNGIMLVNIWISFEDDFRAKSMQAALGIGIKRYQIVLAKWISIMVIAAWELLGLMVIQFIPLIAAGKLAGTFVVEKVIFGQIEDILLIAITMPLTMIVLFQTEKAIIGALSYLYLTMGLTSSILLMAVGNRMVQKFQLWNIGVASQLKLFWSKLLIGQFDIRNFLMTACYLTVGLGASMYLFRKKELDF